MVHTSDELPIITQRLKDNIIALIQKVPYLTEGETKAFFAYLRLTLLYGLTHKVENAYTFNTSGYHKHDVGDAYSVDISETLAALKEEPDLSVSTAHNHPDSIFPSDKDFAIFFKHTILKNMAVCGNIGNLYFIQKGLAFHEINQEKTHSKIINKLNKTIKIEAQRFMRASGISFEMLDASSDDSKAEWCRAVSNATFPAICNTIQEFDTGFSFYCEGM
ncbi:MAG: hypothetical protein FWB88_10580 [Defluviitaleaceae bacterium]|nr:hypothetical protein [Defluviitaleaceae bacterium]MCL2239973.1 hypothetical protein [Defluviitaleaceae bacterium]